jgi:D-proline reductase (dithiol) PrdB
VGLVQRAIEAVGIPTIGITIAREITERIQPPRSLYVPFPMGHPMGRRDNIALQRAVLVGALNALYEIKEPGTIIDSPLTWKGPVEQLRCSLHS